MLLRQKHKAPPPVAAVFPLRVPSLFAKGGILRYGTTIHSFTRRAFRWGKRLREKGYIFWKEPELWL
jgi:hypothetical protein